MHSSLRFAQLAALLLFVSCGGPESPSPAAGARTLLSLAERAATLVPVDPHVKTRARLQEQVALLYLDAGDVESARAIAADVQGWRRGSVLAAIAASAIEAGRTEEARAALAAADATVSTLARNPVEQQWRIDRIRQHIDAVRSLLRPGEVAGEDAIALGIATSTPEQARALLRAHESVPVTGDFDATRRVMVLFGRLHEDCTDPQLREELRQRLLQGAGDLPGEARIMLFVEVAAAALDHGDREAPAELLEQAARVLDGGDWLPDHRIRLAARIEATRYRLADAAQVHNAIRELYADYRAARERIIDIDRADALRAIGKALATAGDRARATEVFDEALTAGFANPNARPRAEDLVATCAALLNSAITTPVLIDRVRQQVDALRDPW